MSKVSPPFMEAIRFDYNPVRKAEITPEGYLRAEATFAKDGILEYRTPTGVRRELRLPEENKKALTGFGLKGCTVEHPPVLLDADNSKQYVVGMSDSTVFYDQGFVRGVVTSFDSKAIDLIKSGEAVEISAGYKCRIEETPGVWNGERYDAIQRDIEVNHLAFTRKGRAGSEVRVLNFDSNVGIEITTNKKRMARITIDSVEFDEIPEGAAIAMSHKLKELSRIDALESQIQSLESQIDEANTERDRAYGRADGFEEVTDAAIPLLKKVGYKWDSDDRSFVKVNADSDDEEDEEWEDEEEEETPPPKKSKKSKSDTTKTDSVGNLFQVWKEADILVPGLSDSRFDSDLSVAQVKGLVISELAPEVNLTNKSDSYIDGVYESIKQNFDSEDDEDSDDEDFEEDSEDSEEEDDRNDSQVSYLDGLGKAIYISSRNDSTAKKDNCGGVSETDNQRMNNYKKPLGMSKG